MIKFKEKLEQILRKKEGEFFALQSRKMDLEENMSNPYSINRKAFEIEEKLRQITMLENIRNKVSNVNEGNPEEIFENVVKDKWEEIERKRAEGEDVTEDTKNFVSLKIGARETIKSMKKDEIREGNQDVSLEGYQSTDSDE